MFSLCDSEEMYAAIDDSSEGNYMQIPEGERPVRPSWLGKIINKLLKFLII